MSSLPEEVPGGNCRVCGGASKCVDSRTPVGYVRRRRECLNPHCARRWSTREIEIDDRGLMIGDVVKKKTVTLQIFAKGPIDVEFADTREQDS